MRWRYPARFSPMRGLADRLAALVANLPLTSEQHESEGCQILRENWHRLEVLAAALNSAPRALSWILASGTVTRQLPYEPRCQRPLWWLSIGPDPSSGRASGGASSPAWLSFPC